MKMAMALPAEIQRSFRLYVTHVDGDGHFLKISGQLDQQSSMMIESMFESVREDLDKGIGAVPPANIHEGIICAVKYKDGMYYRARITNTTNLSAGLVGVHFIDYGNKDIISLSAIRFLDIYDTMFLQLRGQATDYYLTRVVHPSGRWDEQLVLRLQSLLCYAEFPAAIEGQTRSLPIISLQYQGNDFTTHLVSNRFGIAVPVAKQEVMMTQPTENESPGLNWAPSMLSEPSLFAEHVPFLVNRGFPSNSSSAMSFHSASVPFNGAMLPPPSNISQRLLVNNKALRGPVNFRGPIRQPQVASNSPPAHMVTPPVHAAPPPVHAATPPVHGATLVAPLQQFATYKSRLLKVNSQVTVFVSFAEEGPELFAVQLVTDAKKLQDMTNDINRRPHSSLVEPPMIGTVCLGRMPGDKIICRAIVMNVSGFQCKLFFVDFGDTELVSYYDIFDIPEEFVKPNVFSMRFCLSGVRRLEKGPYLNEAFKQLVTGKVMTLRVVPPEGPPLIQYGELYLDNENVLDLLLANMQAKLQFKWMELLPVGSRASVQVSYVDSCVKFYVQLPDKSSDLTAVMEAVKTHCEGTSSPGELPVGAACCARFPGDSEWYRALVLRSENKGILVAYVDYGNEQEVDVSDLRIITPELIKLPAQALKCALKGLENSPVDSKTSDRLEALVLEKTLTANIVGVVSGDTMLVTLVDDTTVPPLDVAGEIVGTKPAAPVKAPEQFSAPKTEHGEGFKREKSYTEERRRDEDFGQREGSFQNRRGKPWESNAAAPSGDARAESPRPNYRDRGDRENSVNKFNKHNECEEKKADKSNRFDRQDRGERRDWGEKTWSQKREYRGETERAGGDFTYSDKRKVQELTDPVPLETPFGEPQIEGAHEVSVTWIISPKSFFVQMVSLQPKFHEMMHSIPELYKGVQPYSGTVAVGGSVLARCPSDGVLYRATVVSIQPPSKVIVQYVDYGNKELVDAKAIWQLDRQLLEVPRMAIHCMISVKPVDGEWKANPEIDQCFNAPRYQCVFQDLVDECHMVQLLNDGVSVVDTLVEKKLALPAEEASRVAVKAEAIDPTVLVGQQIPCRVTHVVSYEKFYVQLDLEMAELVETAVANCDANLLTPLTSDTLTNGVHCTVKHADKIHRAILTDTSDAGSVLAVLPDCGETITTSLANLTILPTELSLHGYQSLECCLNNYTAESAALLPLDRLKAKLAGNKFLVYVDSVEGTRLMTTLYDITNGQKLAIFEPDEGAFDEVATVCARTVYNCDFGPCSVQHVQGLDEVYLQKVTDADRVQALLDRLFAFYEEGTPEPLAEFEPGTHCAAKSSDGNWYRASVISSTGSDVTVQFTDYGNTETVASDVVKTLDACFYEPCAQALVASLGLVALNDDAINNLSEWTTEKEVQVTLAFGADGWLASLHLDGVDLSVKLVEEKLATPQVTEPVAETVDTVEPVSLPTGCTQVYISHIDSPGQFWLQMADKVDKIEEIQAELAADADKYQDLQREMGKLCVAKYSADDLWYRAEVLDLDSDITTVRFIDYGNTDVLEPGQLKDMPEKLRAIEPLAVRSSVNAVPSTGQWSEPAGESFEALVGDTALAVDALIVLKDSTTYADLFVGGRNLTDQLVAQGHATREQLTMTEPLSCVHDTPTQVTGDPVAETVLAGTEPVSHPSGCSQVYISHIDSPGQFWLQMADKVDKIEEIQVELAADADKYQDLQRETGKLCVAKYSANNLWYRAEVLDLDSDITTVRFIDYGNTDVLEPGQLKDMPEKLRAIEPLAVRSSVNAVPSTEQWSEPAGESFEALVGDTALAVDALIVLKDSTTYADLFVGGRNLTDQLVAQGHATREQPTEPPCIHDPPTQVTGEPVAETVLAGTESVSHPSGCSQVYISHVDSPSEFVHLESATPDLQVMEAAMEDANNKPELASGDVGVLCAESDLCALIVGGFAQYLNSGNEAKCKEFRQLPEETPAIESAKCCLSNADGANDDTSNRLDELMEIESTSVANGNQNDVDTALEDQDQFEDARELDSSDLDLDESLDSTHTVIENKSFEANLDTLNQQPDSPEQDTSSSTLESSSGTIKTHERDTSNYSITDTGYTSSDGTNGSPEKAEAEATESGNDKVEIVTKEVETETRESELKSPQ